MSTQFAGLSALAELPDLEDISTASNALVIVVQTFVDDKLCPSESLYTDVEACSSLLSRRPDFHSALKRAHAEGNYMSIQHDRELIYDRELCLICKPALIKARKKTDQLDSYLETLRPGLAQFIDSDPITFWTPRRELSDSGTINHLTELKIPKINNEPSLLLHNLGSFAENETLKSRVADVFRRGKDTFLVNTSGTGKTRLAFEGLFRNWGLYFPLAQDTNYLGPRDIGHACTTSLYMYDGFEIGLRRTGSSLVSSSLDHNIQVVKASYGRILLGRLLLFHMFSELIHAVGISEEHKRLWLLLQLMPQLPGDSSWDIIADLTIYMGDLDGDYIHDRVALLFSKLRKLYGADFHLFYVIDEAQVISNLYTDDLRHEEKPYPLLREVIRGWKTYSQPHEYSFVSVGTDIPKEGFETAPNSDSMHWTSNTGAFDDEAVQQHHLLRYIPPSYAVSPAGQLLLKRIWRWCRGRHRGTDALIKALLLNGFKHPHLILNIYIEKATKYWPKDAEEHVALEGDDCNRRDVDILALNPGFFTRSALLLSTVQQVLFSYLVTGHAPPAFSEDLTPLVSAGYGRFVDNRLSQVVMDEPLFIISAAQWLCEEPEDFLDPVDNMVVYPAHNWFTVLSSHPPLTSNSFANLLAFYIAEAFDKGHKLSKVFSFAHKPIPAWANQKAGLVALEQNARDSDGASDGPFSSNPIAFIPNSLGDIISWLDEKAGPAFCLPFTPNPDLLFVLKLADGSLVRVILHAAASDSVLEGTKLKKIITRLELKNMFLDEDAAPDIPERDSLIQKFLKPKTSDGSDETRVLRVIASFPAKTHLKTGTPKSSKGMIANLNTGLFKTLMEDINVVDVLDRISAATTSGEVNLPIGTRKRNADGDEGTPPRKRPRVISLTQYGYESIQARPRRG
ncbi:hypothetical protein B0H10DRAFT_1337599 [Mycena sp. CBHHK59/15]|nr:hypothetical protein B0H10DRAFT_1337599 [Mycena sp. CBHHK59/15]